MTIIDLLNERQTRCYACYMARADFLPLCDYYQQTYRAGVIDIGDRCVVSRILDDDLRKIVLGYTDLTYVEIAKALMEDAPKEVVNK